MPTPFSPITDVRKRPGYAAINNMRRAIPLPKTHHLSKGQKLTAKMFETMAKISPGDAFPVKGECRFLGLLDVEDCITEDYIQLAHATGEEFQKKLETLLRRAYAAAVDALEQAHIDLADASQQQLLDAFKQADYELEPQHRKAVSLFRGLCVDAAIIPNEETIPHVSHEEGDLSQPSSLANNHTLDRLGGSVTMPEAIPTSSLNGHTGTYDYTMIEGLLDAIEVLRQLPKNPGWKEANRASWHKAIAANVNLLHALLEEK